MKPISQPAELPAAHDHDLADRFLQESDYLPVQGDQSWRELAALRIGAGYDESDETETPDTIPVRADRISGSDFSGGRRGGLLIAFSLVAVLVPVIAGLTAPGILTADFWRTHRTAAPSEPTVPPVRTADVPAPAITKEAPLTPPALRATQGSPPSSAVVASSEKAPPRSADTKQNSSAQSTANIPLNEAALPKQRPSARMANRDETGDAGGFGSFVLGPDGRMQYRFFPTGSSSRMAESEQSGSDDPGFYAKVPGPDGTLRYQHFPSKPPR